MRKAVVILVKNDFNTILANLLSAENGIKTASNVYYLAYLNEFASFLALTKIEQIKLVDDLSAGAKIATKTVKNKFNNFKNAAKLGINADKFESFKQLENANKLASDGSHSVVSKGKNKGAVKFDTQKDNVKQAKSTEIISAKNDAIALIQADAEFIKFMHYVKNNGMDLNLLRLAIK